MSQRSNKRAAGPTRQQIVDAALETLKTAGFAGATSRAIARAGSFNQSLIFYHFGSVDSLLLAALDSTNADRLARYSRAVDDAATVDTLVRVLSRLYREDRKSGHITVVSQMIAGSVAHPELAPAVVERMQPWIELCERALRKLHDELAVPELLPVREVAYAIVTFYLGANLLAHLDPKRTDALFARLGQLEPLLELLRD
jgi:AcrR family transcriptional regulator